jgi:hypothetical protein
MDDLYSLIPVIKRARGYRLYAFTGKRYLDLYLGGGSNLLGHRAPQFVNHLKQAAERGAIADLPSIYTRRLTNQLRSLFPEHRTFLIAPSLPDLFSLAARVLDRPLSPTDIRDPLLNPETGGVVSVWRPHCPANAASDLILPVIPSGFGPGLFVLCARGEPGPDSVPAPAVNALLLAGAAHCLTLLAAIPLPEWYRPDLLANAPDFTQQGIWLVPRCPAAAYPALFRRFLETGLVLSPHFPAPSILPLELSPGELKHLAASFMTEREGARR